MAKKMNYAELSNEDLKSRVLSLQGELSSAHQKFRMGQFKKTSEFSRIRKDVARALTLLRARELGINTVEATEGVAVKKPTRKPAKKTAAKKKTVAKKKK